jgi:hypothetical protein
MGKKLDLVKNPTLVNQLIIDLIILLYFTPCRLSLRNPACRGNMMGGYRSTRIEKYDEAFWLNIAI